MDVFEKEAGKMTCPKSCQIYTDDTLDGKIEEVMIANVNIMSHLELGDTSKTSFNTEGVHCLFGVTA